ncbi:M14 family zinc carboxypeptidase [Pontimicrobium sp. SW4]|uniref:M14 family zinc carboxypeptidase n=1 Tax=Pontimicrobium sp. SW4 TaxID=3153519 RepID=A0AAU7BX51_9FLAO
MLNHSSLHSEFERYKTESLFHRYITNRHIESVLKRLPKSFEVSVIGQSVNDLPIYGIKLGSGDKRVLMWSQMHGNESTTTKACFDLLQYLMINKGILKCCTLYVIPILNPDGAKAYTRLNANGVDLNRDAQDLTQPESVVLKSIFERFKPNFCFNLHGQRTIFSAGSTNNSATVSFLAPAQDPECTVTENRKVAMELIASMNKMLQNNIPNGVGIYDDAFNINCVGDTFQSHNVPTVLFEAGHFKDDYAREEVRKFIFGSLLVALDTISINEHLGTQFKPYFDIPQNQKLFYDIIIRNANVLIDSKEEVLDIAIQYEEVLMGEKVHFIPRIKDFGDLSKYFSHKEINANNKRVVLGENRALRSESVIDFITIDNELFSLKTTNN